MKGRRDSPLRIECEGDSPQGDSEHNEWLKDRKLAPVEEISFKSADGTSIDGFLVKPVDYVPGKRYPTILRIHGGPVYQFSHEFMEDWQVYAANGYAVVAANPRGSSGRGFDFAKAIYADWGNKDGADVIAAVDHVIQMGVADPDRIGVGGHSYGGILTDEVIARSDRFKAAVSSAGSGNMYGMYGNDMYIREYEQELGAALAGPRQPTTARAIRSCMRTASRRRRSSSARSSTRMSPASARCRCTRR